MLGVCALWLAGAGCGVSIISIVFGGLALSSGFRARASAAQQHQPRPFKALLAIVLAVIALAISATSLIDERRARGANSGCLPCVQVEIDDHYEPEQVSVPAVQPEVPACAAAPERLPENDVAEWADAHRDWESYKARSTAAPGYGYSHMDFQRWQREYSQSVHRQRMEAKKRHAPVAAPGTSPTD